MSQDIVCKECAFSNPAGSKFCNNCGAKLPLGTHIICVNCGTFNPIDRVFCDHCGTRLIAEEPRSETKSKDEPAAPLKAAFSLPARRPGETGDLDPTKVPDWLKTGKMGDSPDDSQPPAQDLPRIEELTRKQHTDDLPDWLVDEEDSDPIIHAPTIISTEFYKDLLVQAEASPSPPDDLFPDGEADLPDWLLDAAPTTTPTKAPQSEMDWLAEPPEEPEDTAVTPAATPPETEKSLTSWLSSPLPEEEEDEWRLPQKPADSLTSWLAPEIEETSTTGKKEDESLTRWLSDAPLESDNAWALDNEPDAADLTDWLASETPPAPTSTEQVRDSLTDWLADFPDEEEVATSVQEKGSPPDDKSLTDWFSEAEAEVEAKTPDALPEKLTDWLADFPDEEETWVETNTGASEARRLTDWFAGELPPVAATATPAADDAANWFDEWADETETGEPFPVVDEPDSGSLSGWLAEASAAETDELADNWDVSARLADWLTDETAKSHTAVPLPPEEETSLTEPLTDWPEEETTGPPPARPLPQEAARLTAWFSGETEPAEDEEQFDWLEEPSPLTAARQPELPSDLDWLEETEEELASIFQSQPTIAEEMPDWLSGVAAADLSAGDETADSLADIFEAESKAAATEIDFLHRTGSLHLDDEMRQKLLAGMGDDDDFLADSVLSDEPDWLAALAAMGPDDVLLPELDEPLTAVPPTLTADREQAWVEEPADIPAAPFADEDWTGEEAFAAADQSDELPAWINQLDATGTLPDVVDEEGELIPSDELPDWVASLRPEQTVTQSALSSIWRDKTPDTLSGIPEELAGSDLPEWLQDISHDAAESPAIAMPADTQLADIPDWLQPGLTLDTADADFLADIQADAPSMTGVSDEWSAILDDLPPAVPLQDLLPKADIPAWVMELKPVELTGESPKAQTTGPEETFGPLSGLRGVVAVEPVIALPRVADPFQEFGVSPEQMQQANLLRQLTLAGQEVETTTSRQAARDISGWIRPLFAVALLLIVILGLRGEIPIIPTQLQPSVALAGVDAATRQAAGQTVLVAFEYTPAMAGELTPAAETLLSQLAETQTTVLTLSQYTPGVNIAAEVTGRVGLDTAVPMGYLPGGAIGLRRLGECLNQAGNCESLFGAPLPPAQQQALADVSLIIVLTADRQTLVNWVEQVSTPAAPPMVAGVTQSLAPLALPYFDTAQLAGVLNGIPGTAVYQQTYYRSAPTADANVLLNAQAAAQMLVVVVLLLGAILYFITGIVAQRRAR